MKVLMIGNHESVHGGITSVIQQMLTHNWSSDDIEMKFLATYRGGNTIKKIAYFSESLLKLCYRICFDKPDIVHIHMSHHGSFDRANLIQRICKANKISVIIHLHGSEFEKYYLGCNSKKQNKISGFFNASDAVIVLGEKWKEFISTIATTSKVKVFNNSIEIPKNQICINEREVKFLFLGVLFERKGVMDLLHAISMIYKELESNEIKISFNIAGTGPEESKLKEYVQKAKIEKYVNFVGWISGEEKKRMLLNNHVLVLPSYNEGLPIAILEAISFGLPIISTNVGSIEEAVINNENGFLFTPGDVEALANSILKLFSDANLRYRMSKKSRTLAEEKFDDKKYFRRMELLYKKVL